MSFDTKNIPADLVSNFREKKGVFFVGAGMSVGAGFPTWYRLINDLITEADSLSWISKDKIDQYRKLSNDSSKFLILAEDLKSELGSKYTNYLTKVFVDHDKRPTENHKLMVNTGANLMITINYDDLIEQAYNEVHGKILNRKYTYNQSKSAANNYWKGLFFLLKPHGDASQDVESLILTQKDYRKTLYREPGYRSLLQSIFTTKSIIFVGVSMSDPEFNQLLDYLHDSYHGGGPKHYLLIDEKENNQVIARRYDEDFNIQTISYSNINDDYVEITEFLKELQSLAPSTT